MRENSISKSEKKNNEKSSGELRNIGLFYMEVNARQSRYK